MSTHQVLTELGRAQAALPLKLIRVPDPNSAGNLGYALYIKNGAPTNSETGFIPGCLAIDVSGGERYINNNTSDPNSTSWVKVESPGQALNILDNELLSFGSKASPATSNGGDVSLKWDGTNLEILPDVDNAGAFHIGDGTLDMDLKIFMGAAADFVLFDNSGKTVDFGADDAGIDVRFYGATANALLTWDETNDALVFEPCDLVIKDGDLLAFGDKTGADADVSLKWDGTNLELLPDVDDTGAFNIGDGTPDMDLKVFLGTTSDFALFDNSRHAVLLQGDAYQFQQAPILFDHFIADTLDVANWAVNSDATAVDPAIVVASGGTVELDSANVDDEKSELAGEIIWSADKVLVFEARVKVDDITTVALNVGLNDMKAEGASTIAMTVSGTTITDNNTNGVMFAFDTDMTTDEWNGMGTKAGTQTALVGTGTAPANGVFQILRIEIGSTGTASFFIDGTAYGSATVNAVTAATLLCPYFAVQARTTAARKLTVDYVMVTQGL